jgi:hypothetical protein
MKKMNSTTPLKTIRIADASLLRPFECIVIGFLFGVMALVSSKMLTRKFEWGPEEKYN